MADSVTTGAPAGSNRRERAADILIAASLAIFPLLPRGLTYVGVNWPWALEVFFLTVAFAGVLLVAPFRRPRAPAMGDAADVPVKLIRTGYATWLIPVVAATVIGLLGRLPFDMELWRVEADGLLARLGQPMNQVSDPFYPLRIGLIYLEGGLAFWLLSAALRRTSRPDRRIHAAIDGCLIGIGIVSTVAIVQYFTRANLLEYWVRANPDLTRSHSTLDDPNSLASFLVLGIGLTGAIAWPASQSSSDWRRSRGPLAILALAGAALIATVSRAGLGALIVAAVIVLLREWWRGHEHPVRDIRPVVRGALAVGIGALIVASVAIVVAPRGASPLPHTPIGAFWETFDWHRSVDGILKGRLKLWRAAVEFGREDLSLGKGLGQFPRAYASYPGGDGPENTHNFFLQVFAESGALGFAGLAVLLTAIALALRNRGVERTAAQRRRAAWLTVGVLGFVLTWLTGHPLLNLSNQLWFAAVLAVGIAAVREP